MSRKSIDPKHTEVSESSREGVPGGVGAVSEAIKGLSRNDCLRLLRNIRAIETKSRDDIRDDIADSVRFHLGEIFAESALAQAEGGTA